MWGWEPAGWAAQSSVPELGWVLGEEVGPGEAGKLRDLALHGARSDFRVCTSPSGHTTQARDPQRGGLGGRAISNTTGLQRTRDLAALSFKGHVSLAPLHPGSHLGRKWSSRDRNPGLLVPRPGLAHTRSGDSSPPSTA